MTHRYGVDPHPHSMRDYVMEKDEVKQRRIKKEGGWIQPPTPRGLWNGERRKGN